MIYSQIVVTWSAGEHTMDGGKGKKTKMQNSPLTYTKQTKIKTSLTDYFAKSTNTYMYVKDVLFYIRMGTIW